MPQQKDDLEAVRIVVDALSGFDAKDQERILRWAREKLGLPVVQPSEPGPSASATVPPAAISASVSVPPAATPRDLKGFVAEKRPKSDVQFAATVAYYHRFEARENLRKAELSAEDLQEACRLAGRERLKNPYKTLHNAHNLGLLDKGGERGTFTLNTVGENLVAVALPGDGSGASGPKKRKGKKKVPQGKAARGSANK
jgi:hypothetical protein